MITQINDHEARMIGLLISQFKDKPNIAGILKSFSTEVQEIEDVAYNLFRSFDIDDAVGDQLDLLGRLVGEARQARTDEVYRSAISVRIAINLAHGEPEKIIEVLESITNSTIVQLTEVYPAGMFIFFNGTTTDFTTIKDLIKLMVAAGVRLTLSTSDEEDPFVFDGDPDGGGFSAAGFLTEGSFAGVL